MIKKISVLLILLIFAHLYSVPVIAQTRVMVLEIKETIAPPVWHKAKKAMEQAREQEAGLILIHMNTYGGMLETADSLRTMFLQSEIPVWVFIDNNAASAGALISIACEKIFMRSGASIGAATVVNQTGEKMPDKYQSYMRSMMRATAEARHRDPDIAEAMVDASKRVPGVADSGKVLTLTASEAIRLGFCDGMAESIPKVLESGGIKSYTITKLRLNALDRIIAFLIQPAVSGILILLIIGGIYFEFQSPGIGFPIIISIIAMAFYFAPLYLEGLASHWEILLFLAGLALIAIEIFVIPGFGVAGISGIFLLIAGLTLALVNNIGFDFSPVDTAVLLRSFFLVVISMFVSIVLSLYLSKKVLTSTVFGELALNTVQDSQDGYISSDMNLSRLIGSKGVVKSILRPGGKVEIENEVYDAVAESGYIEKGEAIYVVRFDQTQLVVRKEKKDS